MSNLEVFLAKAAVIGGAGFFLWKVIAGWLLVNIEISIETERQSATGEEDFLAFKIVLKKGNTDTLQIKDIQARIRTQDSEKIFGIFSFDEIHKLSAPGNIINWTEFGSDGRNISLSPNESFHLGRYLHVPSDTPVIVEVVLQGTRLLWPNGFQWHASVVSLPVNNNNNKRSELV